MMAGVLYTYAPAFVIRLRDFRGKTRSVDNDEAMKRSMVLSMVSVTVSCCVSIFECNASWYVDLIKDIIEAEV